MNEQEQYHDEDILKQLASIADCRKRVPEPDVNMAWAQFKARHIEPEQQPRQNSHHHTIRLWMAAVAGAAAMLACVFIYSLVVQHETGNNEQGVIVMRHSEGPQMVTLALGKRMVDMSQMDSLDLQENEIAIDGEHIEPADTRLQSLSTPRGMDFKLTLQDGSEVWLNAESTIEFPVSFVSCQERQVCLKGEAYFKVAHDASKPFVVHVGGKDIKVLGTEFDVRHYEAEPAMVALVKGSIELCDGDECQLLRPGQGAFWKEGEMPSLQPIDTYNVTQWIDGLFYFDEQALDEMLVEVARWYNVGVRIANRAHAKQRIHFSASRNDSLEHLLDDLQTVCGCKITLEGKDIVVH